MRILLASTFAALLAVPAVAQTDPYMSAPDALGPETGVEDRTGIRDSDDDDNVWRGAVESSQGAVPLEDELYQGRASSDIPLPDDSGGTGGPEDDDRAQNSPDDDSDSDDGASPN